MKHTPTPWKWLEQGEANQFLLLTTEGKWVIAFQQNGELMTAKQRANAERIVQCVNAMDGIEKVEDMVMLFNEFADQLKNGVPVSITPNSIYGKFITSLKK